ncbi:MAG: proline iminopeptidase-family hydrolase, partial [Cryomorphaceae bacterium]|nr:proline iminopeptidase-family hydrolase [Cryomorphaceae bacterium]
MSLRFSFLFSLFVLGTFAQQLLAQNPYLKAEEGFVEVEGGRMWYRIVGSGNQAPLLMMHGGPGGTSYGLFSLGALSQDRPLIYFDQLGGGRSDVHQDTSLLTVNHFVEQVRSLVDHLALDSIVLYGHSWGTALALEYYLKYPVGVQAIVFNSPFFNTKEWIADADTLIMALHDTIQDAIAYYSKIEDYNHKRFREAERVYLQHYGRRGGERVKTEWDMPYKSGSGFIYTYMWGHTEFTATGTLKNYNRSKSLREIEVPALFITGEYDEARPYTVLQQAVTAPKGEFAVIPNAGHAT